jgi:hypothetical protein
MEKALSSKLTILTWLWKQQNGRTTYTASHVNTWAAMVSRHLTIPHRLACVTEHPEGLLPSIEIIKPPKDFDHLVLPTWNENPKGQLPQCLRRLSLFRPDAADIFGERFVSMDMDCVVAQNLDPLFDRKDDFIMYRGTNAKRPYNGSMLMMNAGARSRVFTTFTHKKAIEAGYKYLGSDQAWISYCLGWNEETWGPEHGVAWWGSSWNPFAFDKIRIMFFPGYPKPWNLVNSNIWIGDNYQGSGAGRCIILSYGKNVWKDFESVLDSKIKFNGIIVSPEAAKYFPDAFVCNDDNVAERMARIFGYDEIIWCGRIEEQV